MKLLIVRLSAIGDVLHTLPALELLRAALPSGHLTWVVEATASPILDGHPALDELVVVDRRGLLRAQGRVEALRGLVGGVTRLRRARFDAVVDFQGLLRSALVARAAGGPVSGPAWAREGARHLYHRGLDVPRPADAHAVDRAVAIAREVLFLEGIPLPEHAPPARLPASFTAPATPAGRRRLVLLPGAGKVANRVPPRLLAQVADLCADRLPDLEVVVVGGPADVARGAEVVARCERAPARSTCGQLDLPGTGRLLAGASLVIGGDTGPLHLARTLGRPVLGLFHAADPFRTGPAGVPGEAPAEVLRGETVCAPCCAKHCQRPNRDRICLDALTPGRVAEAALEMLGGWPHEPNAREGASPSPTGL